jgi:hypothetical protein
LQLNILLKKIILTRLGLITREYRVSSRIITLTSVPVLAVFWGDNSAGLNNQTNCTGPDARDPIFYFGIYPTVPTNTTFLEFDLFNLTATQPHSHLWIAAVPAPTTSNTESGIIKKILIKNIIIFVNTIYYNLSMWFYNTSNFHNK